MARIKDNVLHQITEMKSRRRKASPGIIDLTCPTQKRSRSASGKDVIVVDDAENLQPMIVDGARGSGRSPSVEIEEERSPADGDIMGHALNWSRFSMKRLRSALAHPPVEFQLNLLTERRKSTKSFTSLSQPPSRLQRSHKGRSLQASSFETLCPPTLVLLASRGPALCCFQPHKQQDHAVFHNRHTAWAPFFLVILQAMFTTYDI